MKLVEQRARALGDVVVVDLERPAHRGRRQVRDVRALPRERVLGAPQPLEEQVQDQHRLQPLVARAAAGTTSRPSASVTAAAGTRSSAPSRCRPTRSRRRKALAQFDRRRAGGVSALARARGAARRRPPRRARGGVAAREHARRLRAGARPGRPGHRARRAHCGTRRGRSCYARPARRAMPLARSCAAPGRARRLAEVLDWARERDVAVNVEMKHDVPNRLALVERVAARPARARGRDVLLSSFDPLLLAAAAALARASPRAAHARATSGAARPVAPSRTRPYVHALHLERTQTRAGRDRALSPPRAARRRLDGERPARGASTSRRLGSRRSSPTRPGAIARGASLARR